MIRFTGKNPTERNKQLKGIPDELSVLKAGDVICTENPMALGSAINTVSSFYSPDRKSKYTHSLIMLNEWKTFEATWFVESHDLFEKYEGMPVLIGRPLDVTPNNISISIKELEDKHRNQLYPVPRLFLHLFNVAQFVHWKRLVCSELVAKFLFKIGVRNHRYFGTSPDNIADDIHRSLNNDRTGPAYTILYEGFMPVFVYKYCRNCTGFHLINNNTNKCPHCHEYALSRGELFLNKKMIKFNRAKIKKFDL
jgi:hypothetical protein